MNSLESIIVRALVTVVKREVLPLLGYLPTASIQINITILISYLLVAFISLLILNL